MLHLALAGNLLCATGGTPQLYGKDSTPSYPAQIFNDATPVNLSGATEATIKLFVKIEEPTHISDGATPGSGKTLLSDYDTIGHFYDGIIEGFVFKSRYPFLTNHCKIGLTELSANPSDPLFDNTSENRQLYYSNESTLWLKKDLMAILKLEDAIYAMKLIVQQGEGVRPGETGVDNPENDKRSHYEIFKSLLDHKLPSTHNVLDNPVTENHKDDDAIYSVMRATDAVYCYLLLSIERLWSYAGPSRQDIIDSNIMSLMQSVLPPLAKFLVKQPTKADPGRNAGPAFNFYEFDPTDSYKNALGQLKGEIGNALGKLPEEVRTDIQEAVDSLVDLGNLSV
ncbi:unnamed protein product [Rhizoctonia solani]|uniref:Iminophenyl-pyruvate dimer synthase domain-containing protein n=1 Tax=Rhizoctonia solani TaxID=456999 RepID=A0A8H2WAN6_9AGAM|nr:unnamed protein product [Rhizoctonia solani]